MKLICNEYRYVCSRKYMNILVFVHCTLNLHMLGTFPSPSSFSLFSFVHMCICVCMYMYMIMFVSLSLHMYPCTNMYHGVNMCMCIDWHVFFFFSFLLFLFECMMCCIRIRVHTSRCMGVYTSG